MKAYLDLKKEIFRWGPIPGKYFYTADFMESLFSDLIKRFPQSVWPKTLILFVDEQMVWLNEFAELREAGRRALTVYMLDKKKRKEIRKEWDESSRKLKEYEQKITNTDLSAQTDDEFRNLVDEFRRRIVDFWLLSIPAECGNYGADIVLDEHLSPFVPKDRRPHVMEIITAPEKMSFYQEEEIDLAKSNNLADHQKKYFWLKNSYVENYVLDISFFKKRKQEIEPDVIKKIIQTHKRVKQRKEEVRRAYNLPDDVMSIADTVSDGIAWQDERKKQVFMLLHYKECILKEFARRTKRFVEEVRRMGLHEFFSTEEVTRKEAYGFYFTIGETKEFSEKETRVLWEKFAFPKASAGVAQCKGIIAQPGQAQGRARVIFDPRKSEHFKDGEVLVAPMTSPDYIFIMKKASAIVTNSGGLTSHAAIISRELQIPCVVGTKIATQIFKDGDLIEVDATKGIIKKLNSSLHGHEI